MRLPVKKLTTMSVLTTIGLLIGYIESIIIVPVGIPGIKLGLSNVISVLLLYIYGPVEAVLVLIARILLSGLLFGSGMSIIYSLAGGLLSFIIMRMIYRFDKISMIGVSVAGGVFHNVGQLGVAAFFLSDLRIFMYMPALLISGVFTGIVVGYLSKLLYARLNGKI